MISVIVPAYNTAKYIKRCINSLINQTIFLHSQIEIIIVDDGSTDETPQILDYYQKEYKNIKVIHTTNKGVSSARNIGIDNSNGKWITFVDSDDYVEEDYFEKILFYCDNTEYNLICSGFIKEDSSKKVIKHSNIEYKLYDKEIILEFLTRKNIDVHIFNKVFERERIGELRFNSDLACGEDAYFLYYYLKKCDSIIIIPNAWYHYIDIDTSAMNTKFSISRLNSLNGTEDIMYDVSRSYPEFLEKAECMLVDSKCRVLGDIIYHNMQKEYREKYIELKKDIRKFSVSKKIRNSSIKHAISFLAMRISPKLYVILRKNSKLRYM